MASLAIDLQGNRLIDLVQELSRRSREDVEREYADRKLAYCCAECLMQQRGLSPVALVTAGLSGLVADSSFRRGGFRRQTDYVNGGYKDELVSFRPAFFHPEPLLDEDGNRIQRPCESAASIHHAYCRWIASSGRNWLLNGGSKDPRHVISVMARYEKDPSWREPDLSLLWAHDQSEAKDIQASLDGGNRIIPFDRCIGLIAVEVQRTPRPAPELIQRTKDHLKHYADVRWVFVERHLHGLTPFREWLAENGHTAYILREEKDKSRILGIDELPPPKKQKTYLQTTHHSRCLRAVYIFWLKRGISPPEALARAKADLADLKRGKLQESTSSWDHILSEIYPSYTFSDKQIWLRHQARQEVMKDEAA